jgi:uncharacterized surface protein with fasciclin (FAS1) repeats
MRIKKPLAAATAAAAALAGVALAAPAQASQPTSLADLLDVDPASAGTGPFDGNWHDFDVVREAAEIVLKAKPTSPVGVLADPDADITAFIPTDRAFQNLERSLTGTWEPTERRTLQGILAAAGTLGNPVNVVEQVLLYHVFPGGAVNSATVVSLKDAPADQRTLTMANGGKLEIKVWSVSPRVQVALRDRDPDAPNAFLASTRLDIRAGDGIAHVVSQVLRPLNLPSA